MFSRNNINRKAFNAKASRNSHHGVDRRLSSVPFGSSYQPLLWQSLFHKQEAGATTAHIMAVLGINPETHLVRITSAQFVDLDNRLISGHRGVVAKVGDPYDLRKNPYVAELFLPKIKSSRELDMECLNVVYTNDDVSLKKAKSMVSGYRKHPGDIVITFKMRDVLNSGARIYPDESSSLSNVLIIALPEGAKIPFKII